MDSNELIILLTLGAVAPYLAEAAISRIAPRAGYKASARVPSAVRRRNAPAGD